MNKKNAASSKIRKQQLQYDPKKNDNLTPIPFLPMQSCPEKAYCNGEVNQLQPWTKLQGEPVDSRVWVLGPRVPLVRDTNIAGSGNLPMIFRQTVLFLVDQHVSDNKTADCFSPVTISIIIPAALRVLSSAKRLYSSQHNDCIRAPTDGEGAVVVLLSLICHCCCCCCWWLLCCCWDNG